MSGNYDLHSARICECNSVYCERYFNDSSLVVTNGEHTNSIKIEDHTNPTISCETQTNTTVAGVWETLTFNFTNGATGTAALNVANTFDMASIFFNFGVDGATAVEQTYYFDDVIFGDPFAGLGDLKIAGFSVSPNPSLDEWTILSELTDNNAVTVDNLQGEIIMETSVIGNTIAIDATELGSGVYLTYVLTNQGTSIVRMVKK